MSRPDKIKLKASHKVTALTTEGAIDRWQPGVEAAIDPETDNVIAIHDVIGEDWWTGEGVTVKSVDAALRRIGNREVVVTINSPGGDVFEGIGIYNRLREHPAQVTVKILGLAASAASVIAMAGDRVEIGEAAFLMIHNAWVMAIGNRHDMREVADFLEPFDGALRDVYVQRTGLASDDVAAKMDSETWIGGRAAVDEGFADALLAADETRKVEARGDQRVNAVRRIEASLCKDMPRSAARDLINELKGKHDAVHDPAKPDAGNSDLLASMAGALNALRGR